VQCENSASLSGANPETPLAWITAQVQPPLTPQIAPVTMDQAVQKLIQEYQLEHKLDERKSKVVEHWTKMQQRKCWLRRMPVDGGDAVKELFQRSISLEQIIVFTLRYGISSLFSLSLLKPLTSLNFLHTLAPRLQLPLGDWTRAPIPH